MTPARRALRVVVLCVATGVLSFTGGSPSWTDASRSGDRPPEPAAETTSGD